MHYVLSRALCLLHPIMPFLTEELWQGMGYAAVAESIVVAPWPTAMDEEELAAWGVHPEAVAYVDAKHAAIGLARNLRADYGLSPAQTADFILRPTDAAVGELVRADRSAYLPLLKAQRIEVEADFTPSRPMPSVITPLGTLFMSLEGHVDVEAEMKRLAEQLAKTEQDLEAVGKRLDNVNFVSRAPVEVVEQVRARKRELQEKRDKLGKLIDTMGAPKKP
jgi:valyl-tRNA synthetase